MRHRRRRRPAIPQESDFLACADCGASIAWRSDEAREWVPLEVARGFVTVCVDCYRERYGKDEADEYAKQTRAEQRDEREP
jgi:hypothetical protein